MVETTAIDVVLSDEIEKQIDAFLTKCKQAYDDNKTLSVDLMSQWMVAFREQVKETLALGNTPHSIVECHQ
jgi:hypothetical protein